MTNNMKLIVEGWRFISQSYAVVNQFQLLEFLKRSNIELFHREMPYLCDWQPTTGLLDPLEEAALRNIPEPQPGQAADAVLRMQMPFDLTPSTAQRTCVFGLTEHGIVQKEMLQLMGVPSLHQVHGNSDSIIVTSSQWSRTGFINSGADGDRVVVVPLGVDPNLCKPLEILERKQLREKLGWQDSFIFLNVSAMGNRKGICPLLKAFAAIAQKYPQARLVLKGTESLYSSKSSILQAIKSTLTDREAAIVIPNLAYIGEDYSFAEVVRLYQAADAYVSPYLAEGFNLPVLEAIACGLPVICTAGGPTDDFTRSEFAWRIDSQKTTMKISGEDRWIFNPNLEHLIHLMEQIIDRKDFRLQARNSGSQFIEKGYTWARIVDRLIDVLDPNKTIDLTQDDRDILNFDTSPKNFLQSVPGLRLNLGCGSKKLAEYINVDKYGNPDLKHDLETFPWPWDDNSVVEIKLTHVLEHLGRDTDIYLKIFQELYRICRGGAIVEITVPHYRHDNFFDDPTHLRAVTPLGLSMFSQRLNRNWIDAGYSCSTLGLNIAVDFELIETRYKPSSHWFRLHPEPEVDWDLLQAKSALYNNLIQEIYMKLEVVK
jgi:glycosyltransferase involved in cell wall biosynthesis